MAEEASYSRPNTAHDPQSDAQAGASILEESLFIRAGELQDKVSIATKDAEGRICWVTLDPTFHSKLVRTAIAATKAINPHISAASIKEALFIFILNILNGKQQHNFFYQVELERKGDTKTKRATTARKGNQVSDRVPTTRPMTPHVAPPPPRSPSPLCNRPPAKEKLCPAKPHSSPASPPTFLPPALPAIASAAPSPEPTSEELDEFLMTLGRHLLQEDAKREALMEEALPIVEEKRAHTKAKDKDTGWRDVQPRSRKKYIKAAPSLTRTGAGKPGISRTTTSPGDTGAVSAPPLNADPTTRRVVKATRSSRAA